jgi:hypothetical protein
MPTGPISIHVYFIPTIPTTFPNINIITPASAEGTNDAHIHIDGYSATGVILKAT